MTTTSSLDIHGHTLTTDGSVLLSDVSAWDFIKDISREDLSAVVEFIHITMPWVAQEPINYVLLEEVKDSFYSILLNEKHPFATFVLSRDELADYMLVIRAMHPFYADFSPSSACDGFYSWGHVTELDMLQSRNYRDAVETGFGGWCKNFPALEYEDFSNVVAAFKGKNTPIDQVAVIAQWIVDNNLHSDYLPFALQSEKISLTPTRLINWINTYPADIVMDTVCKLVEVEDNPLTPTLSSRGNMLTVLRKADDLIAMDAANYIEQGNKCNDALLEESLLHRVHISAPVDGYAGRYAITLLRSAVDIVALGEELDICIGSLGRYVNSGDSDFLDLYLVDDGDRQFVGEVQNSQIVQLRGYKNCVPDTPEVSQVLENFALCTTVENTGDKAMEINQEAHVEVAEDNHVYT